MAIHFACPWCTQTISVDDSKARERVECPHCNRPVKVPPKSTEDPPPVSQPPSVTAVKQEQTPQPKTSLIPGGASFGDAERRDMCRLRALLAVSWTLCIYGISIFIGRSWVIAKFGMPSLLSIAISFVIALTFLKWKTLQFRCPRCGKFFLRPQNESVASSWLKLGNYFTGRCRNCGLSLDEGVILHKEPSFWLMISSLIIVVIIMSVYSQ